VAAAPLPLVQRPPLDATLGGSQANRAALAPAKCTPGRSELQHARTQLLGAETVPSRTLAELQGSGSITPGSFTGHQATGTDNSQSVLLRSFTKLLSTVQISTVQKLFSSSTKCSLILLGIIRFVGRWRQGSALKKG
jgi:hypothetical protein